METQLRKVKGFDEIEKKFISIEKSVEIKDIYCNDIGTLIETNKDNYDHTQFTWLSLETLKSYIATLDEVAKINQKEISGIRIYFAKYPESGDYSNEEVENLKPGRETMFFAPTMKVAVNDSNKDYEVLQNVPFGIKSNGDDIYVGNFEKINVLNSKNIGLDDFGQTSLMMNDVMSYPPPKQTK